MQRHTPRKDKQECMKAIIQMFHSTVPLENLLTAREGKKGRDWAVENYSNESFVVGENLH